MSRLFYHVMQDNVGNLLFDVSGTMRLAGSGTLATIYGDEELTVILPNPMTNHPSFGSFKCFLGAGAYDFYMAKSGYTFETLTGVQGHGTLAQQDASAVAITGGSVTGVVVRDLIAASGVFTFTNEVGIGTIPVAGQSLTANNRIQLNDGVGIKQAPAGNVSLGIAFAKGAGWGISLRPTDTDASGNAVQFLNMAAGGVGSISITGSATAFNTSSDVRLKHAITALTGALDVLTALRPVRFRWQADDSVGHGFLAHELQQVIPAAVTGEPAAVNDDGSVRPQQVDNSKIVVWLVGAVQELTAQVQALTARLDVAGA